MGSPLLTKRKEGSYKLGNDFYIIAESHFNYENYLHSEYRTYPLLFLLPRHFPLMRLPYYINIEEYTPAPILGSGMISYKEGIKSLHSVSSLVNLTDYPNCIVILGHRKGNHFIANLLRSRYNIVLDSTYSVVMKKKR